MTEAFKPARAEPQPSDAAIRTRLVIQAAAASPHVIEASKREVSQPETSKPQGPQPGSANAAPASGGTFAAPAAAATSAAPLEGPGKAAAQLIRIEGELRHCDNAAALWAHLVNESRALLPFGQALLLLPQERAAKAAPAWRLSAISGMADVNRDAPQVRWYEDLAQRLCQQTTALQVAQCFELPTHADPEDPCTADAALRHLLWLPLHGVPLPKPEVPVNTAQARPLAAWLLARDTPWEPAQQVLAERLAQAYAHGALALAGRQRRTVHWRQHGPRVAAASALVCALLAWVPVPLSTLAPVEVTPQAPFVVTAPVAGVVERLLVEPGANVKMGDPLVQLVDTSLRSDADVAAQRLELSRAKMLRNQQASVEDPRAKRELALAQNEEQLAVAERDYARALLGKSVIKAQKNGVALFGDARDWAGRPVAVGEAIMRVADPAAVEYQLKVPVADAVNVRVGLPAKIFLDAQPLQPLEATVVRAAYKAEADAAGNASFLVTARLTDPQAVAQRMGLRGTAQVYGDSVSLFYYLLRRPITALRQWTGL